MRPRAIFFWGGGWLESLVPTKSVPMKTTFCHICKQIKDKMAVTEHSFILSDFMVQPLFLKESLKHV